MLDADVPPAVGVALRERGYDVSAASGDPVLGLLGDFELLRVAAQQGRVVVTFNIVDFSELARIFAHTQEDHAGIILIHSKTYQRTEIGRIARALDDLLRSRESFANSVLFLG